MRSKKDVIEMINYYKDVYLDDPSSFEDDYAWGLCNGLEIALAILEERPAFYIDKYKHYDKYDIENNPEYFL